MIASQLSLSILEVLRLARWLALVLAFRMFFFFLSSRRSQILHSQARLTTPRMIRRALEMDCCRVMAPFVVVVGAAVLLVVLLLLTMLLVLAVVLVKSTGFVLSTVVGVPSFPEVAL